MIEKKRKPLLLAGGAAALLVVGGAAAYWLLVYQRPSPGDIPMGANVIPQDALMAFSVSTDPSRWQTLREFGTPQTQAAFDQNLAQLRDRFLTANGYNYQRDIQPWVGKEATIAFLPARLPTTNASPTPDSSPSPSPTPDAAIVTSSNEQSLVVVLPIENPVRARQLLGNSQQANQWAERTYKGVQIRESQGTETQNYSTTVLDNRFLVVTTDPQATERAIDTYRGEASLGATPGYSAAAEQISVTQPFGKLYVNVPAAAAVVSANSQRPIAADSLAQLQQNQGLAATISLEPEGIRFKGVSWLKPDSQKKHEVRNTARTMTTRLPADTLMMVSGGNLQRLWQEYSQGVASNPVAPINPQGLRTGVQSLTGLDLDKDLMSWMGGEFSLALIPAAQATPSNFPMGLALMVQASDRRAAEQSFSRLSEVLSTRYGFKPGETKVANQAITTLTQPLVGLTVTQGWLDSNVAFLTVGAPLANTFVPKPVNPLANSDTFQSTVPSELNPNNGHFFIDVDRTLKNNQLPLLQLSPTNKAFTDAIRSIGVTAAVNNERSTRYDIFVALQKGGKPGPLPSPSAGSTNERPALPPPTIPSPEPSPTTSP